MPKLIQRPEEMTKIVSKRGFGFREYRYVYSDFNQSLEEILQYAIKYSIDISTTLNKLNTSSFASKLTTQVYGDIRRTFPRVIKTVIPSVLFAFIERSLKASGNQFTDVEIEFINMIHSALFNKWGIMIGSQTPIKVIPTALHEPTTVELLDDMILVMRLKSVNEFAVPTLPQDGVSVGSMVYALEEFYVTLSSSIVSIVNTEIHLKTVLSAIKLWLADKLTFDHLFGDSVWLQLTNNRTLLKMAQQMGEPVHLDGWFLDQSIFNVNEYFRSDRAEFVFMKASELAMFVSVTRFVNHRRKALTSLLFTPNIKKTKWIHWFARAFGLGASFTKLMGFRDPSGKINQTVNALSLEFLEEQLTTILAEAAQYTSAAGISVHEIRPLGIDFDMLIECAALVRCQFVRIEEDKPDTYSFRADESLVVDLQTAQLARMDELNLCSSEHPWIVCALSGSIFGAAEELPIKQHTIEVYAKDTVFVDLGLGNHAVSAGTSIHTSDDYFVNMTNIPGVAQRVSFEVKLKDLVYNGDPIEQINIFRSNLLPSLYDGYFSKLTGVLAGVKTLSNPQYRFFTSLMILFSKLADDSEIRNMASNLRQLNGVMLNPNRPQEARMNHLMSVHSVLRLLMVLGTGLDVKKYDELMSKLFTTTGIEFINLISDEEIRRYTR